MKFRPLKDNVVVQVLEAAEKTKGGKVVAPSVKKGDKILFSRYSGNEVKIDNEEYLIISEKDILAILK